MRGSFQRIQAFLEPRRFFIPFFSFVFPRLCLSCGRALLDDCDTVCGECWSAITPTRATDPTFLRTTFHVTEGGVIDALAAPFYFEEGKPLQSLIHQLKYGGATRAGIILGIRAGEHLLARYPELTDAVIIPVPLHAAKERERGYNQSACIGRGMSSTLHLPLETGAVRRIAYTRSQTTLSSEERKENMEGAFAMTPRREEAVRGRTVVLVDDVVTTGATMRSCAKVLRDAGARRVIACAIALAA